LPRRKRKQESDRSSVVILSVIGGLTVLMLVALLWGGNRSQSAAPAARTYAPELPRGVTDNGLPYLGLADAPVTITVYEDMGCPNCRNNYLIVEPQILDDFVRTGQVRVVVYTLAFVNQLSLPGAEALACAQDQERFWDMRDALFADQSATGYSRTTLANIAEQLDMDVDTFTHCFDTAFHENSILQRSQDAYDFGITATPTMIFAGQRFVGVQPYESDESPDALKPALEAAVAASTE